MKIRDYKHNLKGSNQYRARRPISQSTYWSLLLLPALFFAALGTKNAVHSITGAHAQELPQKKYMLNKTDYFVPTIQPTQTPNVNPDIQAFIVKTFGNDSDKAFKLLSCENKQLDPSIVHVNDDGSKDVGIFQINTKWQAIQSKFLQNAQVNILIAKQLYDESGSFKMWTCGKKLGI